MITDTTLSLLTTGCPLLEILVLSLCEQISDTGIQYLTNNSNASNLKILELDNCQFISDQTLEYLSQLSSLQRIEVYDCQSLSREGIKNFMVSHSNQNFGSRTVSNHFDHSLFYSGDLLSNALSKTLTRTPHFPPTQKLNPELKVHTYFAASTPNELNEQRTARDSRCCIIL